MASPISSITSPTAASPAASAAAAAANKTPSQQTFLQLLVAQIKNQDPLNPSDSLQFVSELAQFSQLEQVIAIRQDIEGAGATAAAAATGAATTTANQV